MVSLYRRGMVHAVLAEFAHGTLQPVRSTSLRWLRQETEVPTTQAARRRVAHGRARARRRRTSRRMSTTTRLRSSCGETGPLLVAFRLASDPALADDLHALVRANVANPTDDVELGRTWDAARRPGDGRMDGRAALGGGGARVGRSPARPPRRRRALAAGRRLPRPRHAARRCRQHARLLRVEPDDALAGETAAVLSRHAFREDGLANWPGSPRPQLARPRDGRICLQWCTGAPGVLAGAWEYLDEDLLLAGAELIWQAGAHGDEKGHGLCHGTSGNGFALLKAFARTGDERWLERARRFAVHALGQAERIARRERPRPLLALDRRRRHRPVRRGLPRRRRALPDPRFRLKRRAEPVRLRRKSASTTRAGRAERTSRR